MLNFRRYEGNNLEWDNFVFNSLQANFLHTQKFLSYHKNRFLDLSLIIENDAQILALFPAAEDLNDSECVVSHPGITFGGLLHQGGLKGELSIEALNLIKDYYSKLGYKKLIYKCVPHVYHKAPCEEDIYALFRLNAKLVRCDLSSTIDNSKRLKMSERRRRSLKKAEKNVTIEEGAYLLKDFWGILEENLRKKYNKSPVHDINEIQNLASLFPDEIICICAIHNSEVVAGVLLFDSASISHAQYIASNDFGHETSALDAVFNYSIIRSEKYNKRWFDFGISTENNGLYLNSGLYSFKSEFGAGGIPHEFYLIDLKEGL